MNENYKIKPITEEYLKILLEWRNSDRIHSKMLTTHKISWEEHLNWYKTVMQNSPCRNFIFFCEDRPLGYLGYNEFDKNNKSCSPGAYIGEVTNVPEDAGIYLFYYSLEYAFTILNMERVETSVFEDNKEALTLDLWLGYSVLQDVNEMLIKDGKERKVLRLELKKNEWLKKSLKIKSILGIN